MTSTITNLILTIDTAFPVAGQDNDSQGFRNNFNIIQQSLLATEGQIENIENTISTLGGTTYSTATHIVALEDVTIGRTDTVVLSVHNGDIVAKASSSTMVLLGLSQTIQTSAIQALTDSVLDTTANMFAVTVSDAANISIGAKVTIDNSVRTVTNIDYTTGYITVTPAFPVGTFNSSTILTFNNPYNAPSGNLFIDGDIEVTGNITAYSATSPSDARLKENVATIQDALSKVKSMRGVYYDWTDAFLATVNYSPLVPKRDTGVIAQELQEVLPEVVFMKANGDLAVKYEKIVGVLIEGIKELSDKVDALQAQVNSLTPPNV